KHRIAFPCSRLDVDDACWLPLAAKATLHTEAPRNDRRESTRCSMDYVPDSASAHRFPRTGSRFALGLGLNQAVDPLRPRTAPSDTRHRGTGPPLAEKMPLC